MSKSNLGFRFKTDNLSPMQLGRLGKALETLYSFSDGVWTLRYAIERMSAIVKSETDGMLDYNRAHFNRLGSNQEQEAYIARLKVKRLYYINDINVPKIVYDAVLGEVLK